MNIFKTLMKINSAVPTMICTFDLENCNSECTSVRVGEVDTIPASVPKLSPLAPSRVSSILR